jgi:hypothetical protein
MCTQHFVWRDANVGAYSLAVVRHRDGVDGLE